VHWIDFAIVGGYVAYSIASGLGSRKLASRGLEEYFLAGRSLKGWQAGVSMAATQFAADTPLVVTGMVATAGVFALWRFWVYAFAFLLMALVLGAAWRRSGVLTDAELSEFRYSGKSAAALRGAKAVYLGVIFNCTVLAMVLKATASVTEPFFLWNEWLPQGLYAALEGTVQVLGFPLTTSGAACADGACEAGSFSRSPRCIRPRAAFAASCAPTSHSSRSRWEAPSPSRSSCCSTWAACRASSRVWPRCTRPIDRVPPASSGARRSPSRPTGRTT
jgi:hypothetical protein